MNKKVLILGIIVIAIITGVAASLSASTSETVNLDAILCNSVWCRAGGRNKSGGRDNRSTRQKRRRTGGEVHVCQ